MTAEHEAEHPSDTHEFGEDAAVDETAETSGESASADPSEAAASAGSPESASVEELIVSLELVTGERDEYLDTLRRNQADFENYRKRVAKQLVDDVARATGGLVEKLLAVLDACDGAITHGAAEVEPIFAALLGTLEKEGLERVDPADHPFDPNLHEAVFHEEGDGSDEGTVVSAVLRPGYTWKGQVVRPAMVKVRG